MNNFDLDKLKKYLDENWIPAQGLLDTIEDFIDDNELKKAIVDIGATFLSPAFKNLPISKEKNESDDNEPQENPDLHNWLNSQMSQKESFQELLQKHLVEKGYSDKPSEFYNKVYIDRRLFSRISSEAYQSQPDKKTVFKVVVGFELNPEDSLKFLESAGYSFNFHKKFDMIIKFCLKEGIYSPESIDRYLVEFDEKALFSIE